MNQGSGHIAILSHGSVSSLGIQEKEIWDNYLNDSNYISHNNYWKATLSHSAEIALKELIVQYPKYRKLDRSVLLSIIASEIALKKYKLNSQQVGINIGSSRGATISFEEQYEHFSQKGSAQLLSSPLTTLGNISSNVARHLDLFGPIISHSITCSTALQAITNAYAWLKSGMSDYFLVGGSEAPLTDFTIAQMKALGIYSENKDLAYPCQPLGDLENNSMVLGEGAASFILGKYEGQPCEAIIESIGYGFETTSSLTGVSQEAQSLKDAMNMAILNSSTTEPIDLILLHAPGTLKGDESEWNAVKSIFNDEVNLYSNKFKTGHTLGASGAFSIELAILCIKNNQTPAIPYASRINNNNNRPIKKVMINAMGFGGNASSIIVSSSELF